VPVLMRSSAAVLMAAEILPFETWWSKLSGVSSSADFEGR